MNKVLSLGNAGLPLDRYRGIAETGHGGQEDVAPIATAARVLGRGVSLLRLHFHVYSPQEV